MKRYKNLKVAITLLIILLYCSGCNWYISEVPISNSKRSSLDTNVLGEWGGIEDDTLQFAMKINAINDHEYVLSAIDYEEGTVLNVSNYVCHISDLGKDRYVNVRILDGEDKGKYFLARYELMEDTLKTFLLHEDSLKRKFDHSRALRNYIKRSGSQFKRGFVLAHELQRLKK